MTNATIRNASTIFAIAANKGAAARVSYRQIQGGKYVRKELATPEDEYNDLPNIENAMNMGALTVEQIASSNIGGNYYIVAPKDLARRSFELRKLIKSGMTGDEAAAAALDKVKADGTPVEFSDEYKSGVTRLAKALATVYDSGNKDVAFERSQALFSWVVRQDAVPEGASELKAGMEITLKDGADEAQGVVCEASRLNGTYTVSVSRDGQDFIIPRALPYARDKETGKIVRDENGVPKLVHADKKGHYNAIKAFQEAKALLPTEEGATEDNVLAAAGDF